MKIEQDGRTSCNLKAMSTVDVIHLNTAPTAVFHLNTTSPAAFHSNITTPVGVSDNERLQYLQQLQDETNRVMLPAMIFMVLLAVLGLVGNCLVLWVYSRRFKTNPTRLLIITLACLDLVANVGAIPGEIYDMFHTWDFENPHLCRARLFVNSFTTLSSGVALTAIAIIRYRKICRPHSWQVSNTFAKFTCPGVCLLGAVFAVPFLVANGRQTKRTPRLDIVGYECSEDDSYKDTLWPTLNMAFFLFLFLVCFGVMVVLYVKIGLVARRSGKIFSNLKLASKSVPGTDSSLVKTSKALKHNSSCSHVAVSRVTYDNYSRTDCTQLDINAMAAKQTFSEAKHIPELKISGKTHFATSAKFPQKFKEISDPYCQVENSFHSCETESYCTKVVDRKNENIAKQVTQSIVRNSSSIHDTQLMETSLIQESLFVNSKLQCVNDIQKNSTINFCCHSFGLPIEASTGQETVDNIVRNEEGDDRHMSINTKPQTDPSLESHHSVFINKQEKAETTVKSNIHRSRIDLNTINSKDDIITNQPSLSNISSKGVELQQEQHATKDKSLNTAPCSQDQVSTSSGTLNITPHSQYLVFTSPETINIALRQNNIVSTSSGTLNITPHSQDLVFTCPETINIALRQNNIVSTSSGTLNITSNSQDIVFTCPETINIALHPNDIVSTSSGTLNITPHLQDLVFACPGTLNIAPQSQDIVSARTRTLNSSTPSHSLISTRPRTLSRTTSILIIISAVFALSYLPFIALSFFMFMDPNEYENMSAGESSSYNVFYRSYFINAAVNPIVYSLCGGKFSQECMRLLKCK